MYSIYKYELLGAQTTLRMHKGAEILCVQVQEQGRKERPCLWALVDTLAEMEERHFKVYGTGHEMELAVAERYISGIKSSYIGTFQLDAGALVFHVFEVTELVRLMEDG